MTKYLGVFLTLLLLSGCSSSYSRTFHNVPPEVREWCGGSGAVKLPNIGWHCVSEGIE
jgi:hypothetical protein